MCAATPRGSLSRFRRKSTQGYPKRSDNEGLARIHGLKAADCAAFPNSNVLQSYPYRELGAVALSAHAPGKPSANEGPRGPLRGQAGVKSRLPDLAVIRLFSPPVLADERQANEALKVWAVLMGFLGVVIVFLPLMAIALPQFAPRLLLEAAGYTSASICALYVNSRGHHRPAATLLLVAMLVIVCFISWTGGGVRSPALMAFPLIIAIAGILKGPRAAAITGLTCAGVSVVLLAAETLDLLPPARITHTAMSSWLVLQLLIVMLVLVHWVGGRHMRLTEERAAASAQERRRAEEAQRASERRFRQLFEQAQVGIYRTTPDGKILEANPALLAMLGYRSLEELSTRSLEGKSSYAPQYSRQTFRDMVEKGDVRGLEAEWRRADGQVVFVRENARAIRDDEGRTICYEGTVEDFTERKQLENQRRQSSKMEAIGHLAGGVAHDFNNILAGFLLNIGLMQQEPDLSETVHTSLSEMELQTKRAASLTRRLLLFSRRQVMELKQVDLNELLEELAKMLRRIVGENYELTIDCESQHLGVRADASMIDQVVMNLCVNARDAMAKGGHIVIRTSEAILNAADTVGRADSRPGRFARVDVIDTGCGMSEATMKHLFEPFFTTKDVGKGTGLGLATVYSVVQQHSGWVEVASTPGKGSRFSVFLPTSEGGTAFRPVPLAAPVRLGMEGVLLVEDEPAVRTATRRFLERLGYRVLEAASGQAALEFWKSNPAEIDLLLTDMVLPGGMTGLELAEKLKARQPSLKIILCSGYNSDLIAERGDKAIGAIYLAKPFTAEALSAAIRECVDSDGPHKWG